LRAGVEELNAEIGGKLADLEVLAGHAGSAFEWNSKALAMARRAEITRIEAAILLQRAALNVESGSTAEADAAFADALAVTRKSDDHYWRGGVLMTMAISNVQRARRALRRQSGRDLHALAARRSGVRGAND
jgi:hypothetical protein